MSIKKYPIMMFQPVSVGDGAVMSIENPTLDPTIQYALTYGQPVNENIALQASAVLGSFDYLLSSHCTMREAVRRLRILRAARRELFKGQR